VWVDLEMSGLNEHKDVILEIALVLTDGYDLSVRIEGPELAIKAS
jgi:oligoribonuclease